jgi:hypothetical protein
LINTVGKNQIPKFEFQPREFAIGIRAIQCLALTIENCHFRISQHAALFGAGILVQGDNGKIETLSCRFTGEAKADKFVTFGVCLAPILLNEAGRLQLSSIELLRVCKCEFAFVDTAILLSSQPLYVWIEKNLTRSVRSSLVLLWYGEKVQQAGNVFEVLDKFTSSSNAVKKFVSDLTGDQPTRTAIGISVLLSLGDLKGQVDTSKRIEIYTLGDIAADAMTGIPGAVPENLRLTLAGNQFESRVLTTGKPGGVDTLIWDLTSNRSFATLTGNTAGNLSGLPTVAVLRCAALNITGNVIGNALSPSAARSVPALLVQPGDPRGTDQIPIDPFTVTGNTIVGTTNLADFVRDEWAAKLPKELAAIVTWEFFNTIA